MRRLIVTADDFGASPAVNEAVRRAHAEGILTSASLMVNEVAAAEAVAIARSLPALGVGLHLVLSSGRAALSPREAPRLVTDGSSFPDDSVALGLRYFVRRRLRAEIEAEIRAQVDRFRATGLHLDHIDGHKDIQLHPVVSRILATVARETGAPAVRIPGDDSFRHVGIEGARPLLRLPLALFASALSRSARAGARRAGLRTPDRVIGHYRSGRMHRDTWLRMLPRLPPGVTEITTHPCADRACGDAHGEMLALVDPEVRELIERLGIRRVRYGDLRS